MMFSLIILAFVVYVLLNTKIDGDKISPWVIVCVTVLTMLSPILALIVLAVLAFLIYKGVKEDEIDTLDWIEKLINDL